MTLKRALVSWWARRTLGRDDGVCPHVYEADASGPGDVEGTWRTESRREARNGNPISRVMLRYPFWPEVIAELARFELLESVVLDAEGSQQSAKALAANTVRLPTHRRIHVFVVRYVGKEKPEFLREIPPDCIHWFGCPSIAESEPLPVWL